MRYFKLIGYILRISANLYFYSEFFGNLSVIFRNFLSINLFFKITWFGNPKRLPVTLKKLWTVYILFIIFYFYCIWFLAYINNYLSELIKCWRGGRVAKERGRLEKREQKGEEEYRGRNEDREGGGGGCGGSILGEVGERSYVEGLF